MANPNYSGGLNLNSIYGRKKPSESATEGSAYAENSSSTGPYGGSDYASPYVKPAANPNTDGHSASTRPPAAAPSPYSGPSSGYTQGTQGTAIDEGEYASRPGYGRQPDHAAQYDAAGDYGRKPGGYGGGEYETQGHSSSAGTGYGRKPASAAAYSENENFETRRPSQQQQHESQYSAYSENNESFETRRPSQQQQHGSQYSAHDENENFETRRPSQSQYSAYGESANYEARPPPSQYENEGGRRPQRRPESEYSDNEAPRPTGYGSAAGAAAGQYNKHGNPSEEEERRKPHYAGDDYEGRRPRPADNYGRTEGYGRSGEDDRLASQTAGLSLGSDKHGGRRTEEYRPKRGDSDDSSGDEGKRHNKHKEKHGHQKKRYDNDDY